MIKETKEYKQYSTLTFERNNETMLVISYAGRTKGTLMLENDAIIQDIWQQKIQEINQYLANLSKI